MRKGGRIETAEQQISSFWILNGDQNGRGLSSYQVCLSHVIKKAGCSRLQQVLEKLEKVIALSQHENRSSLQYISLQYKIMLYWCRFHSYMNKDCLFYMLCRRVSLVVAFFSPLFVSAAICRCFSLLCGCCLAWQVASILIVRSPKSLGVTKNSGFIKNLEWLLGMKGHASHCERKFTVRFSYVGS